MGGSLQNLAPPCWHPQPAELRSLGVPSTGGGQSHSSESKASVKWVVGRGNTRRGELLQTQIPTGPGTLSE